MKEEWRDIPDYEGYYQVSNLGSVRSLDRVISKCGVETPIKGRVLKPANASNGYKQVALSLNGILKTRNIHQLVAEAFLGFRQSGHSLHVHHKNENKTDNRECNLEILTDFKHKRTKHGEHSSKYVGVNWSKASKKWKSGIRICRRIHHLGYHEREYAAHVAYQRALRIIMIFGEEIASKIVKSENKPTHSSYA